jgi:uncharacterized membrane protein YfcA
MLQDPVMLAALLVITGIWAGALNAVAGGGTFFSFPVLLLLGTPPLLANTTNKCGLWFAALASASGFWREIASQRHRLTSFAVTAFVGSIAGSLLLLVTPAETFQALIPWLLLTATGFFAGGKRALSYLRRRRGLHASGTISHRSALIGQSVIGLYGGFFAAGMGILMMALYELSGVRSVNEMNGLKTFIAFVVNGISAITFMLVGMIDWKIALYLGIGAVIGGYVGAILSRHVPDRLLRRAIILYGVVMSALFFYKY